MAIGADSSVLAVDPGAETGLAWCGVEDLLRPVDGTWADRVGWGTIDGSVAEQSWKIGHGMVAVRAKIVVSESSDHFLLLGRKGTLTKHSLVPIKLSGALDAVCAVMNAQYDRRLRTINPQQAEHEARHGIEPFVRTIHEEQTPSQAKSVVTNDMLVAYGFEWARGKDRHAMDAMRHLILFCRRYKEGKRKNDGFYQRISDHLGR